METKTYQFPAEITIDRVYSAYNGKIGCMCGCNGTYAYASKHSEFASKNRGYKVDGDEVNDRKLKMRYLQIKNHLGEFIVGDNYVYVERGERCFAIYFK